MGGRVERQCVVQRRVICSMSDHVLRDGARVEPPNRASETDFSVTRIPSVVFFLSRLFNFVIL